MKLLLYLLFLMSLTFSYAKAQETEMGCPNRNNDLHTNIQDLSGELFLLRNGEGSLVYLSAILGIIRQQIPCYYDVIDTRDGKKHIRVENSHLINLPPEFNALDNKTIEIEADACNETTSLIFNGNILFNGIACGTEEVICGNGVVEQGEECDDGNSTTEACDYGQRGCQVCDRNCSEISGQVSYCGDGVIQAGEECDDGNTNDNDACRNTCQRSMCVELDYPSSLNDWTSYSTSPCESGGGYLWKSRVKRITYSSRNNRRISYAEIEISKWDESPVSDDILTRIVVPGVNYTSCNDRPAYVERVSARMSRGSRKISITTPIWPDSDNYNLNSISAGQYKWLAPLSGGGGGFYSSKLWLGYRSLRFKTVKCR